MPSTTSPSRLEAASRRKQALDLRKQGYTYAEIGCLMGYTATTCCRLVKQALTQINRDCRETAAELQQIELEKLDQMEVQLNRQLDVLRVDGVIAATKEAHRAMELRLKVSQQRCKLLGLTAPQQVNQVVVNQAPTVELVLQAPEVQKLAAAALRELEGREVIDGRS